MAAYLNVHLKTRNKVVMRVNTTLSFSTCRDIIRVVKAIGLIIRAIISVICVRIVIKVVRVIRVIRVKRII